MIAKMLELFSSASNKNNSSMHKLSVDRLPEQLISIQDWIVIKGTNLRNGSPKSGAFRFSTTTIYCKTATIYSTFKRNFLNPCRKP